MLRSGSMLVGISLVLAGCSFHPRLETTNCDPMYRDDCWSVSESVLYKLMEAQQENERLRAAMKFCQEKL